MWHIPGSLGPKKKEECGTYWAPWALKEGRMWYILGSLCGTCLRSVNVNNRASWEPKREH